MFSFAVRNLLTRPLRSLLALCGLTVAIMGMVGLFSVAEGIDLMVTSTFKRIPGLLVMQPGAPIPLFSRLPSAWADELRAVPGVHAVNPEVWSRAQIIEGKPTLSPPRFLSGIDPVLCEQVRTSVYRDALKEGRFLNPTDKGTFNTLISRTIAEEFHKKVGDTLRVDGRTLKIIGIYQCGSLLLDVAIIFDIDKVREMARMGSETVCSFYVEPERFDERDKISAEIKNVFRGRSIGPSEVMGGLNSNAAGMQPKNILQGLITTMLLPRGKNQTVEKPEAKEQEVEPSADAPKSASADDDSATASAKSAREELPVEVRSSDEWAGEFKRFSADLEIFLLIMTSIGVTIATLGIINTMLMSVTERFIEFGILKANGWTSGDVLKLIAFESLLLGLMGGIFGSILGWCATLVVNARWSSRVHLYASPGLIAFSIGFSIFVGLLGGLYPAIRASRMLPMDAIRRG